MNLGQTPLFLLRGDIKNTTNTRTVCLLVYVKGVQQKSRVGSDIQPDNFNVVWYKRLHCRISGRIISVGFGWISDQIISISGIWPDIRRNRISGPTIQKSTCGKNVLFLQFLEERQLLSFPSILRYNFCYLGWAGYLACLTDIVIYLLYNLANLLAINCQTIALKRFFFSMIF